MRRAVEIAGRSVEFAASAATPRNYRVLIGRDLFEDFQRVAAALSDALDGGVEIPPDILTVFEDIAWCMAHEATPRGVPDTPSEWLEELASLPIRVVFPALEMLWLDNLTQTVHPAKK